MKIVTFGIHQTPNKSKILYGWIGAQWKEGEDICGESVRIHTDKTIVTRTNKRYDIKPFYECKTPPHVKEMIFEKYDMVGDVRVLREGKKQKKQVSIYDSTKRATSQG